MTKIIDTAADLLNIEKRGFFIVQYDSQSGGVDYRYKFKDYETMLGFLVPVVDAICNEFVESEGYLVHESIRQTVEKTMQMNEKRPDEKLFEESVKKLREIFAENNTEPEDEEQNKTSREMLIKALRCCSERNCVECPFLPEDARIPSDGCRDALMETVARELENEEA